MKKTQRLFLLLIALALLLCSCAAEQPDMIGNTAIPLGTDVPTNTTIPASTDGPKDTAVPASTTKNTKDTNPVTQIDKLEVFVDATFPMMGFVDTTERSEFLAYIDCGLTSAKQCFPNSHEAAYRVAINQSKADAELSGGLTLSSLADPSFFLSEDLTYLPTNVYASAGDASLSGQRMNEFRSSYYTISGQNTPVSSTLLQSPVAWTVRNLDNSINSVAMIISDLSELQSDTSSLTSAIQEHVFAKGKTVGILALRSSFSGLVPMGNSWFVWGAPPTGTLWKMLDYGFYNVGVSIDPAERDTAQRPFYILFIGESDSVNTVMNKVQSDLNSRFANTQSAFNVCTFDTNFATNNVDIGSSVRRSDSTSDGVNILDPNTELSPVQLQRMMDSSRDRYIEYEVNYPAKATDPRLNTGDGFTTNDFQLTCELKVDDNSTPVTLSAEVSSVRLENANVYVRLRLHFPYKGLERGTYQATASLYLNPPTIISEPDWVLDYHIDFQSKNSFDGSRTVGLNGLFKHIASNQKAIIASQRSALGSFNIEITVND